MLWNLCNSFSVKASLSFTYSKPEKEKNNTKNILTLIGTQVVKLHKEKSNLFILSLIYSYVCFFFTPIKIMINYKYCFFFYLNFSFFHTSESFLNSFLLFKNLMLKERFPFPSKIKLRYNHKKILFLCLSSSFIVLK